MSDQVTIYLNAPVSPAGKDWQHGELRKHTAEGAWIVEHVWGNGPKTTFYPAHQIQRIEYR